MMGSFLKSSLRARSRLLLSWMFEMSVNSAIVCDGKRGGRRLEKKSFKAVATALTGMSSSRMETEGSVETKTRRDIVSQRITRYKSKRHPLILAEVPVLFHSNTNTKNWSQQRLKK